MANAPNLKQTLISVCEQLKTQQEHIALLMCDSVALRELALKDPETSARYEKAFATQLNTMKPTIDAARQLYELLIQQLNNDSRWLN
jgi:hypothetical protein